VFRRSRARGGKNSEQESRRFLHEKRRPEILYVPTRIVEIRNEHPRIQKTSGGNMTRREVLDELTAKIDSINFDHEAEYQRGRELMAAMGLRSRIRAILQSDADAESKATAQSALDVLNEQFF
jgi:hypothetical protein